MGSGWRRALEALCLGAADSAPLVSAAAVSALDAVVSYLEATPSGATGLFPDTVLAVTLAAKNPHHEAETARALAILIRCIAIAAQWHRGSAGAPPTTTTAAATLPRQSGGVVTPGVGDRRESGTKLPYMGPKPTWHSAGEPLGVALGALADVAKDTRDGPAQKAY